MDLPTARAIVGGMVGENYHAVVEAESPTAVVIRVLKDGYLTLINEIAKKAAERVSPITVTVRCEF